VRGKTKRRLDHLLVERGLADSRTRARALIMAGAVFVGEQRLDKPGREVPVDVEITVRGRGHPWASRGGLKLERALEGFAIDVGGAVCLDVGASTGGFTDVLLHRGAARVYALDVGFGQLDWRLRNDPRVTVLERLNCRRVTAAHVPEPVGVIVCDVSFIGLEVALPAPLALAADSAWLVALIKPQFEAGPERVGKGGIVRDPWVRQAVCHRIGAWIASRERWRVHGLIQSPIAGADGNIEYLIAARRT
jgi:23S rRNA (cytidine1920-2'-O)/16S rRNA (cytidine1409-2'-O)-methyltransferase